MAIFNKYHEINEATIKDKDEDIDNEANVIIGSPDLLVELADDGKIDFSKVSILVVDDINLIKKNKQLGNLEKILEILPANKQNIVYTNRRSKETQSILEKILKAPQEIKVDKAKEQEAQMNAQAKPAQKKNASQPRFAPAKEDPQAIELMKKYNSFQGKTPEFVLIQGIVVENDSAAN